MQIDSKLATAKARIGLSVSFLSSAFIFGVSFLPGMYQGRSVAHLVALILALFYLYLHLRNPYYFFFDDAKKTLTIRFYNAHPLFRKPKMFQIPFKTLDSFLIEKKLGGLQSYLILNQKTAKGIFKYPAVSISLLSKKEQEILRKTLNTIRLKNIALKR